MNSNQHAGNPPTGEMPSNGTENINMGTGTAYPIAAGAKISVPELPMPGDCQRREQQQRNDFFGV